MSSEAKAKADECIQVVVRCRPLNKKELDEKRQSIIDIDVEARQVSIKNPDNLSEPPKYFTYDAAYDDKTQQKVFYDESCFNVIEGTLEGFNSTIFAYGQTGCGKSFTMQGPSTTVDELKGVMPNAFTHIFQFVKASKDMEVMIRCSYLELYNEEIKDLLSNQKQQGVKCELKEDPQKGVYVKGLTTVIAQNCEDLYAMLDRGLIARTTAATNMNAESSRSHSIFTVIVEMSTKDPTTGKEMLRVGKLNLVDLAGSERQKKTGATDATLKEGIKINLSLSALGNVISALSEGSKHIPYRDSKLTRLLQDSLGGNTKTMMIAAISPADYNYEETMSTLRYANRAKNIKNKPKINEDPKDAMIREFKEEIERLRKLLAERDNMGVGGGMGGMDSAFMANMMGAMMSAAGGGSGGDAGTQERGHHHQHHQPHPPSDPHGGDRKDYTSPVKAARGTYPVEEEEVEYSPDKDHHSARGSGRGEAAEMEREHSLREVVETRLHQLEGMLVHEGPMAHSMKMASSLAMEDTVKSELLSQPWAPTAEEIEEEEEAARQYERRRQEARKKKEAQQAREMQRILEERKAMEEELEELRASRGGSSGPAAAVGLQGTSASANNSGNALTAGLASAAEVQAQMTKKLSRMRKKYEKKLAAAKEALEDLQEDFSYQRRQFVEAATEQEKDLRLYQLICESVLSEKDLKRIIEKCRYDEENDEWIVPFGKKRNISDSQWQEAEAALSPVAASNGAGGSKMFPDINLANGPAGFGKGALGQGQGGGNFQLQAVSTLRDAGKLNGGDGGGVRRSPVPLLTLPGNLVTPASLIQQGNGGGHHNSNSNSKGAESKGGGGFLPQISSRSDVNSSRQNEGGYDYRVGSGNGNGGNGALPNFSQAQVLPQQMPAEKKKKSKSKAPKSSSSGGNGAVGGIGYSLGSAREQEVDYSDQTDNDNSYSSAQYAAVEAKGGELEGAGEFAGPLEDWGFAAIGGGNAARGGEASGPELEYSDDEDFDLSAGAQAHYKQGDGPYPPSYGKPRKGGKKKKKSSSSSGGQGDDYAGGGGGGGKSSFALPPI